jgi:hypothetical protein
MNLDTGLRSPDRVPCYEYPINPMSVTNLPPSLPGGWLPNSRLVHHVKIQDVFMKSCTVSRVVIELPTERDLQLRGGLHDYSPHELKYRLSCQKVLAKGLFYPFLIIWRGY